MKAYKFIYVFNKNNDISNIEYKENFKQGNAPEENVKEVLESCINIINEHYGQNHIDLNIFAFTKLASSFCFYKIDEDEEHFRICIILMYEYMNFYPIQLYGTDAFEVDSIHNDISEAAFTGKTEAVLKPTEKINFEMISYFIKSKGNSGIRNMLDIILDDTDYPVFLSIQDRPENIVSWIAAIQMGFPFDIAHNIFFLIDLSNSNIGQCIITKSENGIKSFKEIEGKEIYSFNFITGRISKAISEFRLTRLIEMSYIISPETLNAFHSFIGKFNYKQLDSQIEKCYRLFNMINFGFGNTENKEIREALEFACQYGSQIVREEIFEYTQNILTNIDYNLGLEKIKILSDFMYKTAVKSRERIYLDRANDFFFGFLDEFIMKSNIINVDEVLRFYGEIKNIVLKYLSSIIRFSCSKTRLIQIVKYLGEGPHPSQSEYYFNMIINDLIAAGYSWNRAMHIEGFKEFINACAIRLPVEKINYGMIFDINSKNIDYFAHVSLILYNRLILTNHSDNFIGSFSEFVSQRSQDWVEEIRLAIYEIDTNTRLLFEEFLYNLKRNTNRVEYFWESFKYGQSIPKYLRSYAAEAVKIYFYLTEDEHSPMESKKLIRFIIENEIKLDNGILKDIIKEYEDSFQLIEPEENEIELIYKVDAIKREKCIITFPDVSGLICYALWISKQRKREGLKLEDILENHPDFRRIDNRHYQYLLWCLPYIIEYAEVSDDHKEIINLFCRSGEEEEFYNLYVEIIKKICIQSKSSGYSKILNFLLAYYYYILPQYVYLGEEHLIEVMNQKIIELLEREYIRNINDLDRDLTYEFKKRSLSVPVMWKEIYEKSREKRGNPLFNRLRRILIKEDNAEK